MNPQERELIESVFSRLAQLAGAPKDAEAAALIAERARALPDALYGLVQAVAVQEVTLRQAQAHIAELEQKLAGAAPAAGGGFLGAAANPWAPSGGAPRGASPIPTVAPPQGQPVYAAQPAASAWGAPAPAAGGFMRNVATTAAGMAGGMLLAEGISSLFGGHHGGFGGGFGGGSPWGGGGVNETVENVTVNNYYGDDSGGNSVAADDDDNGANIAGDIGGGGDDWA